MIDVPARDVLAERIRHAIDEGAAAPFSDDRFNDLARAVFTYQYSRNTLYRRYCDARGVTPDTLTDWKAIPAVPTDAFKAAPLLCGDPADAVATFRTSGTSRGASSRGAHYFLDLGLYRGALRAGFRRHLLPDRDRIRILSLVTPADEAPDSSLSFMIAEVMEVFGVRGSSHLVTGGSLDRAALMEALDDAIRQEDAVLIVGTSFSFVHFLDDLVETGIAFALPRGSRVMDTGGFKGRSREVRREDLYGVISERLGVPPSHIVNEYGMTEMSSQFYDRVVGQPAARGYRGPGWVRTLAADPDTLVPLAAGKTGILRHVDLANLDSVSALQTADVGKVAENGEFELRGRNPGAEPRGCSIAMDELLSPGRRR